MSNRQQDNGYPSTARVRARRPSPVAPSVASSSEKEVAVALSSSAKVPVAAKNAVKHYIAVSEAEVEQAEPLKTGFFDMINQVKAVTVIDRRAIANRPLADVRGYQLDDLLAIAEVAYHYLMNGGTQIAVTLFEGLVAVKPSEPYFYLGLGLALDHHGSKKEAFQAYTKASELDPNDGRPDVNRAELLIEGRDLPRAKQLLQRGVAKARSRGDSTLERKADALLTHISRAS